MQIPVHKIDDTKLFIKYREIKIVAGSVEQAHRHEYFQFMFLEQVKGNHEIDFESYTASNFHLHFVGKSRVHKVDFAEKVKGGVLLFPESIFGNSDGDLKLLASLEYFKNGAYPILKLSKEEYYGISKLIQQIRNSLAQNSFEMSKYLLFALLIQVRDIYNKTLGNTITKRMPRELIQFNQLTKKHIGDWNSVEDYLKEIGITVGRMNALCKEYYGQTTLQIIHKRKLLEAKRLLVYTEKQVKEIAYDCGFDDVAYFNRFFKKHTRCTPLDFRKNH